MWRFYEHLEIDSATFLCIDLSVKRFVLYKSSIIFKVAKTKRYHFESNPEKSIIAVNEKIVFSTSFISHQLPTTISRGLWRNCIFFRKLTYYFFICILTYLVFKGLFKWPYTYLNSRKAKFLSRLTWLAKIGFPSAWARPLRCICWLKKSIISSSETPKGMFPTYNRRAWKTNI